MPIFTGVDMTSDEEVCKNIYVLDVSSVGAKSG